MDKNFKISTELEVIMNLAKEYTVSNKLQYITLESVIYEIIKRYFDKKAIVESPEIKDTLDVYTDDLKKDILRNLDISRESAAYKYPDSGKNYYNPNNILLSELLSKVYYSAKESKKFFTSAFDSIIIKPIDILYNCTDEIIREAELGFIEDKFGLFSKIQKYKTSPINQEKPKEKNTEEDEFKNFLNSLSNSDIFGELFGPLFNDEKKDNNSGNDSDSDSDDEKFEKAGKSSAIDAEKLNPDSKTPNLDRYAVDMVKKALDKDYDPIIGRDKEIEELIEILCCRKKNNACITGCPGGGKSAIVEKLAQLIAENKVPKELQGKRIFSLDLNALVSGTQYRGQYEERLQNIIKEVRENKNLIIFIDEMHNLVGNGGSENSGDGANILKPYLARGEFQMIGATTSDEYRKIIEKDGALKRRFTQVQVEEPTVEETIKILKGISKQYSNYHKVSYTDEVFRKCAEWSGKYINDRFFPDKAISILDMASSMAKLTRPVDTKSLEDLEKQLQDIIERKSDAIFNLEYDKAEELKKNEAELEKTIATEKKKLEKSSSWTTVTIDDVASVISKISNVPIDKIRSTDMEKVSVLKNNLDKKIIGQEEAVNKMVLAIQRNILGLRDPKKPIYSALLLGKTGTGKTLTAKKIAEEFFGSESSLELISGAEYSDSSSASKLIGSNPGYVGYGDEPRLYVLRKKPYCCLVIDEFEKFNKDLYNVWLNILEEGEVTLSNGEKISCRNCIILFTSNCGTKSLESHTNIGYSGLSKEEEKRVDESVVMKEVKKEFRPEFLNRLNSIIVYNSLGKEELRKIFDIEIKKVSNRLKETVGYTIKVSESLKNKIIDCCDQNYGARDLQREITDKVENTLCNYLLDNIIPKGTKTVNIDLSDSGNPFVNL